MRTQRTAHHERKTLGEVPQHLKRDAPGAKHDRRPQLDHRNVSTGQRATDLLAAHEMLGLGSDQSTEVDDASDAGSGGRSPETLSQLAVAGTKVSGGERVHKVVGDLASDQGLS